MRIKFYGTGASEGFPALFCECPYCMQARRLGGKNLRTRTSTQIDEHLLIDFSADTNAHALYGGLDLTQIQYLLVTHSHSDHFYPTDLTTIYPPMADTAPGRHLEVYGNETVRRSFCQTLPHRLDTLSLGLLSFTELAPFVPIQIAGYEVLPLLAAHDPAEQCYLYRISKDGKSLLYAHDTAYFPEDTWAALAAGPVLDCVVLDCTSVGQEKAFDHHMSFADDRRVRERLLKASVATEHTHFIATHFAHTFGPLQETLTKAFAPYGFLPAYDGMVLEF